MPSAVQKGAEIAVGGHVVATVHIGRGAHTAAERARAASTALQQALKEPDPVVRVEHGEGYAVVYAGKVPIVELSTEDASLAGAASLDVHAQTVASNVRERITAEQKRNVIATSVFSASLVVFFGLIALYVVRKIGQLSSRARAWIVDNPERIPAIHLQSLEVVRPATLRSSALVAVTAGKWLAQIGVLYAWLVGVLSLFASTRGYTERLTGFVLAPLSGLMQRLATALPVVLVLILAAAAVVVLVRFVGLFFASVARAETTLYWLPADLAAPTGVLLQAATVVGAIVFAAPVVTGDPEGALARTGMVVLAALGLASTPLLASGVTGIAGLFMRRLRIGDFAEFGGRSGKVVGLGLLEVRLLERDGVEVRVPHLLSLFHPTRILGRRPRLSVHVTVPALGGAEEITQLLQAAALDVGDRAWVELLGFGPDHARYRVTVGTDAPDGMTRLAFALRAQIAEATVEPAPREAA